MENKPHQFCAPKPCANLQRKMEAVKKIVARRSAKRQPKPALRTGG